MKPVKIAVIGAGSAEFSAGIVRDLSINANLDDAHVTLMDIDEKRLDNIEALARKITREIGSHLQFSKTLDRERALDGADFVINTVQVGGHGYVEEMRALGDAHGYYRGTMLYNVPQMIFFLKLAQDMERICPDAWLIQSGNPVFEGCSLIRRKTKVKTIGLCHGHYGYQQIARELGLEREHVTAQMSGFNHWIFMTDFRYRGENAYPMLDEWIAAKGPEYWATPRKSYMDVQLSRAACDQYRLYGLMPIGDTPRILGWWYNHSLEAKKEAYGPLGGFDSEIGWGMYLKESQERVDRVARIALDPECRATDTFKPKQSGEQIVPIIESLRCDIERVYQVNIPNKGQIIKGFPEDLVVECPGLVNGSGVHGIAQPDLPERIRVHAMIPRWQQAEAVIHAVGSHDQNALLLMLLEDHRTRDYRQAESALNAWIGHPKNQWIAEWFLS